MIKTNFLNNGIQKENILCTCIACIIIDSVTKMHKKNYPQVYLECKYRLKKLQMSRFINTELDSDSESDDGLKSDTDSDSDSDSDSEFDSKFDSDSDSDSE